MATSVAPTTARRRSVGRPVREYSMTVTRPYGKYESRKTEVRETVEALVKLTHGTVTGFQNVKHVGGSRFDVLFKSEKSAERFRDLLRATFRDVQTGNTLITDID